MAKLLDSPTPCLPAESKPGCTREGARQPRVSCTGAPRAGMENSPQGSQNQSALCWHRLSWTGPPPCPPLCRWQSGSEHLHQTGQALGSSL